jgi:hypothetical protein
MNTSKLFSLRNLALTAMSLLAMIFAMPDAKAQETEEGVYPTVIVTEIENLPADGFPLTTETVYETTNFATTFDGNGIYHQEALQGAGQVSGVLVSGTFVPVGGEGTVDGPAFLRIRVTYDKANRELHISIKW